MTYKLATCTHFLSCACILFRQYLLLQHGKKECKNWDMRKKFLTGRAPKIVC